MHDQLTVGVLCSATYFQHQRDAIGNPWRMVGSPDRDRLAFYILHHQIRLALVLTRIKQPCNTRVRQARQQAPLAQESFHHFGFSKASAQEFDGGAAFKIAVVTRRKPHGTHTAFADLAFELG
jgi:hypothetical protein